MSYATDAAFRAALETRLATRSRDAGIDLGRLRRRVVFERVLARLEQGDPGRWILKGGMALEVRWQDRARTTRDLDLAVRHDIETGDEVRRALAKPLSADSSHDRFRFTVGEARDLQADEAGRPGWKIALDCGLAGRQFASVKVDVVVRPDEITRTERIIFPSSLVFAGIEPGEIEVVDRNQHFAEKLHALTRTYGTRPNTRTRDLADLVLLIDDGLEPSKTLLEAADHVFVTRGTHPLPTELPDPPIDWAPRYVDLAVDLDVSAETMNDAMTLLRAYWRDVLSHKE